MNYQSPYDYKQAIKTGFIYLLIASPFILVVATILTILKAPIFWIMFANIVVGGGVILIEVVIHNKIKQRKEEKLKNEPKKFDPFKD